MAKRDYHQYCALAHALDFVGERWTLLIVRELLTGPKRFTDLLEGLPGVGTNLLAARLKDLESTGIIQRRRLPPPAASTVYEITDFGAGLQPAIVALLQWGTKTLGPPREGDLFRPGWSVLAMHSAFRPEAARGIRETYEFHVGDQIFHACVDDGTLKTGQGPAANPDLVISADPQTFLALASRQLGPAEAVASGIVQIQGSPEALKQCATLFGLATS